MKDDAMDIKHDIQQALKVFKDDELFDAGLHLFATLGYDTSRQSKLERPDYQCFYDNFVEGNDNIPDSKKFEQKALVDEWKRIELLFQLTESEMRSHEAFFDTGRVDDTIIEAYLFFAIELKKTEYTRTALSDMTRQFNRAFPMPVLLLFKYGEQLTLSVVKRRLHKRDEHKDVLEKVTLIKDIDVTTPHRAHIEILFDLSLDQLKKKHPVTNFVELHNAWQKTLDSSELNKKFYQRLFDWYVWALQKVKFPQIRPESDMIADHVHQSESLIRLLTRLLFVWFMKEKGLISESLFDPRFLQAILKDFQEQDGEQTIYYKAILQNLFFATLNQPIAKRKVINAGFNPREYGDPLIYRYAELFRTPDALLSYFEQVPFLNGGLFECLDQKMDADHPVEIRLDGFSSRLKKQPIFPDKYFFGQYADIDLSAAYEDRKKKSVNVTGLIDLLQHYKFTIEENTPIEEEIALDPELLGKVFENLLASYNPETQTTARKQTGSFYTPREIVDYMVDESLLAYLKQYVDNEPRLRALLAYDCPDDVAELFTPQETGVLLRALDKCKVLDPACGSGAFPMGMLQKMIHILRSLDSKNHRWLEMVIRKFPAAAQAKARERLKQESWNYVRKLGIIQQCIYGVDIQPVATQIAKLRFFISLLVDQKVDPDAPNQGLEPLPNLDFKIVTANTLIAVPESVTPDTGLFAQQLDPFFQRFEELTGQFFTASEPADKKRLKHKIETLLKERTDDNIRQIEQNFKTALDSRYNEAKARKHEALIAEKEREIALWRSYLNLFEHKAVGFFESRYFFPNISNGLDIVIGNPPFVQLQKFNGIQKALWKQQKYHTFNKMGDIYCLFYEKGYQFLRSPIFGFTKQSLGNLGNEDIPGDVLEGVSPLENQEFTGENTFIDAIKKKIGEEQTVEHEELILKHALISSGVLCFISSNKWMRAGYGIDLRKFFIEQANPLKLVDFGSRPVFDATVDTCILLLQKTENQKRTLTCKMEQDYTQEGEIADYVEKHGYRIGYLSKNSWIIGDKDSFDIRTRIEKQGIALGVKKVWNIDINYGIKTGYNPAFIVDKATKDRLLTADPKNVNIIKPVLRGKDIQRFISDFADLWLINTHNGVRKQGLPRIHVEQDYPVIFEWFKQFQENLESRTDRGGDWTNLRNCAYLKEFEKPKIMWGNLNLYARFAFDEAGSYLLAPSNMLTTHGSPDELKYLLAILNSKVSSYYMQQIGYSREGGYIEYKKVFVEQIPIKKISEPEQAPFKRLVDYILYLKQQSLTTSGEKLMPVFFEQVIDGLVYELYFPESFQKSGRAFFKYLQHLPILDNQNDKMGCVKKVFRELYNKEHPIRNAVFFSTSIKEVKVIENAVKI